MASRGLKIEVKGVSAAMAHIARKGKEAERIAQKAVDDATLFLEAEVKASVAGQRAEPTSVNTSRFLNSVTSKAKKMDGTVYSDVFYAPFLEYGTSKMQARRHFNNSANRNRTKIADFIRKKIKKL